MARRVSGVQTYMPRAQVRVRYLKQDRTKSFMNRLPARADLFALGRGQRQGNSLGLTSDRVT